MLARDGGRHILRLGSCRGRAVDGGGRCQTGHVPTYAEKLAVARAAERVYGVKAVASEVSRSVAWQY
jgi:hypothetical protein